MENIKIKDILLVCGDYFKFIGNEDEVVVKPDSIERAQKGNMMFIISKDISVVQNILDKTEATLIFCNTELFNEINAPNSSIVYCDNPRLNFVKTIFALFPNKDILAGIDKTAVIDESCKIGKNVYIGPFVSIGKNCVIGDNCQIYPNCVLYQNTDIGNNVILNSCVTIGDDGFGYEREKDGKLIKFLHFGRVIIGNNVKIGSNTCIDRGTMGNTTIGDGTKIDNLVHIAHNVSIGKNCLIVASAKICGSVSIGDNVWIGPGAIISSGVKVANNAYVTLGSVVTKNVEEGKKVSGNFAIDHDKFIEFIKKIR